MILVEVYSTNCTMNTHLDHYQLAGRPCWQDWSYEDQLFVAELLCHIAYWLVGLIGAQGYLCNR